MCATWTTIASRKAEAATRIAGAVACLRADLAVYARKNGGKFVLYGSAARGEARFDSDVDVVLDFPADQEPAAWRFVEDACRQHRLLPDVLPRRHCDPKFMAHIAADAEEIS